MPDAPRAPRCHAWGVFRLARTICSLAPAPFRMAHVKHVVFAAGFGALGDLQPLLAIAARLVSSSSVRASVLSHARFAPAVRTAGAAFIYGGPSQADALRVVTPSGAAAAAAATPPEAADGGAAALLAKKSAADAARAYGAIYAKLYAAWWAACEAALVADPPDLMVLGCVCYCPASHIRTCSDTVLRPPATTACSSSPRLPSASARRACSRRRSRSSRRAPTRRRVAAAASPHTVLSLSS